MIKWKRLISSRSSDFIYYVRLILLGSSQLNGTPDINSWYYARHFLVWSTSIIVWLLENSIPPVPFRRNSTIKLFLGLTFLQSELFRSFLSYLLTLKNRRIVDLRKEHTLLKGDTLRTILRPKRFRVNDWKDRKDRQSHTRALGPNLVSVDGFSHLVLDHDESSSRLFNKITITDTIVVGQKPRRWGRRKHILSKWMSPFPLPRENLTQVHTRTGFETNRSERNKEGQEVWTIRPGGPLRHSVSYVRLCKESPNLVGLSQRPLR